MHGSTRDRLEELLTKGLRQSVSSRNRQLLPVIPDGHLDGCQECSLEVDTMREQADWLRTLRASDDLDAAPGFYARVLQKIEEHAKRSIWYGLVYSPVGKRLAYASLSLALVLGFYVIAAEEMETPFTSHASAVAQTKREVSGANSAAEQRDAVLVNLASYGADALADTGPAQP